MGACDECTRADLLRATAGRGLPAIEPGMPLPAGTGLTHRSVLLRGAGLALGVYGVSKAGFDAEAALAAGPSDVVLVQVYLEGGIDTLGVLAPTRDATFRRLRGALAPAEDAGLPFAEDERLRWHSSAAALATLHAEGKVTVLPAMGYEHPDQSHFVSRHFYEVGALDPRLQTGWLGRWLDRHGSPDNPLQGLSLDHALAPALATARTPVSAVASPAEYAFWARDVWGDVERQMLDAFGAIGRAHAGSDPALRDAGRAAAMAGSLRETLLPFRGLGAPPVPYPGTADDDFPQRLQALAAMLGAGLGLRVVSLTAPGAYDTHADQREVFDGALKLTCDGLLAFQRDLEARGLADRVLIHVWSEFGRRAEGNGSGTDHGAAGLGLVIGTRAAGRMVGEYPGVDRLDEDGNLRATADFRALYAALLEQWLGTGADEVLPGVARFARPVVVR